MDISDAMDEYKKIEKELETVGLSMYEARAFVALVILGVGSAELVAKTAMIPRTSAYKVLDSLVRKGFAVSSEGRPKIYKPVDLGELRSQIIERINELFDKLEFIQEFMHDRGEPQLVYTIYGEERVFRKIAELIDMTENELIISTPVFSEIRKKLLKNIEQAIGRGVKVIVITLPNQKVPPKVEVYRKNGLIATDIVSDNKRALLTSPELNACGYTDNPTLANHLRHFINIMIENEKSLD